MGTLVGGCMHALMSACEWCVVLVGGGRVGIQEGRANE